MTTDYSKTVNLFQTAFPMKADLPVREPLMQKAWEDGRLYERIQKKGAEENRPVFLLHDGPPYANGEIHMGHALNKVLKDIVVKYKTAAGYRAPYKPGWDCHGLPIEHQLFKQMGKSKHQVSRVELRTKATEYALGWVDKQRAGFKRLGVLGDWDNPYLTLSNGYVSGIVRTFFDLKDAGFVYKGLKPGYWCAFDETALAEAEVEYADKQSDAVFVRFRIHPESVPAGLPAELKSKPAYVVIWTTTPWTLPANTGLAFHPDESYTLLEKAGELYVVAEKLAAKMAAVIGVEPGTAPRFPGAAVVGLTAANPVVAKLQGNARGNAVSRAITADYVTMEDGTGVVHIAPGHGVDDFRAGQKFNLPVISPVSERGLYVEVGAPLDGLNVLKDANAKVIELLGADLLKHDKIKHSYMHCWRCKNPIIFRATEQWFLEISDAFRVELLKQIGAVTWEPAYGIHRIQGMVEQRPDWCLSRQRHWGAPIAVFHCTGCNEMLWDKALNSAIVKFLDEKGATAFYEATEADLLALAGKSPACAKCGKSEFRREMDILDVWFDSGVSWHSVVERELASPKPEQTLYLEGSDQHRGWFQTSLIPSVALRKKAPYDVVLTHGFVVDGKGHKMSKSLGNVMAPQEINEKFGADVLRLWVAASDYREDVRLSQDIVKHTVDIYRRFRNTFRFFLQNTVDFDRSKNEVPFEKMEEVDRWILTHFEDTRRKVVKAYDEYQFHLVLAELNRFLAVPLSGFYLDALKDRLYCEKPDSPLRRSTQTALFHLARGLAVLSAPILSFTAEEAYMELRRVSDATLPDSVFLDSLKGLFQVPVFDEKLDARWLKVLDMRRLVNEEMDRLKKDGVIGSSQEAAVILPQTDFGNAADWPFALQVSEVAPGPALSVGKSGAAKCARCWRHRKDVGATPEHPALCGRCSSAVLGLATA